MAIGIDGNNIQMKQDEARQFLLRHQGLLGDGFGTGRTGIMACFDRLGCIQYDPLHVVGRNPDLVLQSRIDNYSPMQLEHLLYTERCLMDGWDKMMAIYPTEDWPRMRRVRERMEEETRGIMQHRNSTDALSLTEAVIQAIRERGPLPSTALDLGSLGEGRWGHRNLSGVAMDYLFHTGVLGISRKKNTQKSFDLMENLLPASIREGKQDFEREQDFLQWYFLRRIGSIGLLWQRNGGGWLGHYLGDKPLRSTILTALVEQGALFTVQVEGVEEPFYVRRADWLRQEVASGRTAENQTSNMLLDAGLGQGEAGKWKVSTDPCRTTPVPHFRFLAPLDNLLWDRDLISRIFGFTYTWEVYVPQSKRKYGYYVLPVLYGDRLVARFEPDPHRGGGPLRIKQWWWEPDVEIVPEMKQALKTAFQRFCKYLGAEGVDPEAMKSIFRKSSPKSNRQNRTAKT